MVSIDAASLCLGFRILVLVPLVSKRGSAVIVYRGYFLGAFVDPCCFDVQSLLATQTSYAAGRTDMLGL